MHSPDAQPCEALVAAWQTLEQFWYDELGEDSAEVARPQGNRKVPRVEVRAALRSLGAAAESPPRSAGWDTPQRVPSDRQLQRPPHLQRQEWAHLVPQLAATGKQLLPDSDGGVQHSSAAQRSQRGPGLSSHRGAGGLSVSGCRVRQQAASASEADEVVCAEGSPEEVFAVQRDTQEAPLVSWAAPRPRHARAPCAHSGAEAGTSEQAQARGVATEQGCKAGWEWLLTHQDTHDRAALEQGLPPVRPHLSACEQLVTLAMDRWWDACAEPLTALVNVRLRGRAKAREAAMKQPSPQCSVEQPSVGPSEPSETLSPQPAEHSTEQEEPPTPPDTQPEPQFQEPACEEEEPSPGEEPPAQQPIEERTSDEGQGRYDWRMWFLARQEAPALGQGILTQQGYQLTPHQQPAGRSLGAPTSVKPAPGSAAARPMPPPPAWLRQPAAPTSTPQPQPQVAPQPVANTAARSTGSATSLWQSAAAPRFSSVDRALGYRNGIGSGSWSHRTSPPAVSALLDPLPHRRHPTQQVDTALRQRLAQPNPLLLRANTLEPLHGTSQAAVGAALSTAPLLARRSAPAASLSQAASSSTARAAAESVPSLPAVQHVTQLSAPKSARETGSVRPGVLLPAVPTHAPSLFQSQSSHADPGHQRQARHHLMSHVQPTASPRTHYAHGNTTHTGPRLAGGHTAASKGSVPAAALSALSDALHLVPR